MASEKNLASLPRGKSFFDQVIEDGSYYIDKTLLVKDLLDGDSAVTLCARPRRFGKTLNQTMLKCFFEDTAPIGGKDTRTLFNGLKIESAGNKYMEHQGKYPVIFLSFKEDDWGVNYEDSCNLLKKYIASEFERHAYAIEKMPNEYDYSSLKLLSECLEGYHSKRTIILIDNYDVILENALEHDFYEKMLDFILSLFGCALKDNPYLQFSVMTGRLRICKMGTVELNNLTFNSVLDNHFKEFFDFTQNEFDAIIAQQGAISPAYQENSNIIRKLIDMADTQTKTELGTLMSGGVISKVIHEDITYDEVYKNADNIWNFMFFTGYLKKVGQTVNHKEEIVVELKIPNKELDIIFVRKIQEWFNERVNQKDFSKFHDAILSGNAAVVQEELGDFLLDTISYMDGKEDFYHGIMLGVLSGIHNYNLKSNRETGLGRCDIVMKHSSGRGKAVIFELKWTSDMKEIEKKRDEALKQIIDGKYAEELRNECYNDVIKYGIAFCQKSCEVGKLD